MKSSNFKLNTIVVVVVVVLVVGGQLGHMFVKYLVKFEDSMSKKKVEYF